MSNIKNKTKCKIRSKRLKTKTKSLKKGGVAFDKGSYGCVFRPPLHCKQSFKTEGLEYISKFMTKEDADKEIKEMKNIKKILLENNKDNTFINKYYILANEDDVCEIDIKNKKNIKDLTEAAPDNIFPLYNRNTKIDCRNIYISFKNVKKYNHEFRSLNLIDGGSSLYNYLENPLSEKSFNKLNEDLIDLLENGIYTMNKLGIYHCDLKAENLVYKDRIRMIDWGFAIIIDSSNKKENLEKNINHIKILEDMYYGLPFTNVLLIKDIEQGRNFFKNKNKCQQYYKKIYKESTPSPYFPLLNTITPKFLNGSGETLTDYAIDNLVDVIFSELTNETFFYDVFLPNADIFAFLQIYIKIYKALIDYNKSTINIKKNIINLLYKYILTTNYASKPFDISEIIADLRELNNPISSIKKQQEQDKPNTEVSKQLSELQIESDKAKGIIQPKYSYHKHSRRKHSRHKHLRRKRSRRKN